jgi:hypothetical protein
MSDARPSMTVDDSVNKVRDTIVRHRTEIRFGCKHAGGVSHGLSLPQQAQPRSRKSQRRCGHCGDFED